MIYAAQVSERARAKRMAVAAVQRTKREAAESARREALRQREAAREIEAVLRHAEQERALLEHPALVRLVAMLRTPRYMYDASEDVQGEMIDTLLAIPPRLRRVALGMSGDRDPFGPLVRSLSARWNSDTFGDVSLDALGAVYGLTHERIRQIEAQAMRKLRARKDVREMHSNLGDIHSDRDARGVR